MSQANTLMKQRNYFNSSFVIYVLKLLLKFSHLRRSKSLSFPLRITLITAKVGLILITEMYGVSITNMMEVTFPLAIVSPVDAWSHTYIA